jgi:ankyrin repeat protein
LLIDYGADLEIKNDDGDTPLMLAVRSEHPNVVDLVSRIVLNI